jgi:hypothetical protein
VVEANSDLVKAYGQTKAAPELVFQKHIADFLVREHGYGVLEQSDITDTEHFVAEGQLWTRMGWTSRWRGSSCERDSTAMPNLLRVCRNLWFLVCLITNDRGA